MAANCTEALGLADGDFAGDGIRAQRLCHLEAVVHHVVRKGVDAIVLDDLDQHAGIFVFLAEGFESVHRLREPPLLLRFGDGRLLGLLFRRQRRAGGSAGRRGRGPRSRRLEVRLHRLQAQFGGAEIELRHVAENVVRRSRNVVEAVRRIDAHLYAAENRVGLGGPDPRRGQRRQSQFADISPCVNHVTSMIACFAAVIKPPASRWRPSRHR